MKRWIFTLVLALALLCPAALAAEADAPTEDEVSLFSSIVASGQCGDNATWSLDSEGALTISGSGEIDDYYYTKRGDIQSVVIRQGITSIGRYAFYDCSSLVSIDIPNTVTNIGEYAFSGCSSLTDITIPSSVTNIGNFAFYYCSRLTDITIPGSVTSIGSSAFYGCSSLNNVYITDMDAWCQIDFDEYSATPMYYAQNIFLNNQPITEVAVPSDVKTLKDYTFYGFKDLTSVTLPAGLTNIGRSAFSGCSSLVSIDIPSTVTSIGSSAFYGCSSLVSIDIPNTVTSIGADAFSFCFSLVSIDIPSTVTRIGIGAFSGCSSLNNVFITDMDAWYQIRFDGYASTPMVCAKNIYLNDQPITAVTVPSDVKTLEYTFYGFKDLQSVTLPAGLTGIGECALTGCSSLVSITIPGSVTSIGTSAFSGCSSLTDITIPEGVTSIGKSAFYGCSSLVSIDIPSTVTSIGSSAFDRCSSLNNVNITDLAAWCNITFGSTSAHPLYYSNSNLYLNGAKVEALEIPSSVSTLKQCAFYGARCIKKVYIPKALKSISASAFYGCTGITDVYYEGSQTEWNTLTRQISSSNDPILSATLHLNATAEAFASNVRCQVSPGGTVTVPKNTYAIGETVTVTATPYTGYELKEIRVDGAAITGNTFEVTGEHVVSAIFARVGGTGTTRIGDLTVTVDGVAQQTLPKANFLVTVPITNTENTPSVTVTVASYGADGKYQGMAWLTFKNLPMGATVEATLPVDNTGGKITALRTFVVGSLTNPTPLGSAVTFGNV